MDFAYYLCDTGTGHDRVKGRGDLLALVGMGFVGFDDEPGFRTVMHRPFTLGVRIPHPCKRQYALNVYSAPGYC